jgi:hypothetical protein
MRSRLVLGFALAFVGAPAGARADLAQDASRIETAWRAAGASVTMLPTRFLWDEEILTVRLPPRATSGACTTVALVGARGASFRGKLGGMDDRDGRDRAASIAGVAELVRCDGGNVDRIIVSGDAGRGAVEVIVAVSAAPLAPLRDILPERTGGVVVSTSEPGPLPSLPPIVRRIDSAEARAKSEGAKIAPVERLDARSDGTGGAEVDLEPGCHRIELLAHEVDGNPRVRFDVDAELRDSDDDTPLARDRSEAADARLYTCVGVPVLGSIAFAGAPSNGEVTRLLSSWPIPEAIPRTWGPQVRAKMTGALLARGLSRNLAPAVHLAQGGPGLTSMPVPVEPGACYVAMIASIRGRLRQLALRASIGALDSADERGAAEESGAVAFCTRERRSVRLDVEARGSPGLWWAVSLHRTQSAIWEAKK